MIYPIANATPTWRPDESRAAESRCSPRSGSSSPSRRSRCSSASKRSERRTLGILASERGQQRALGARRARAYAQARARVRAPRRAVGQQPNIARLRRQRSVARRRLALHRHRCSRQHAGRRRRRTTSARSSTSTQRPKTELQHVLQLPAEATSTKVDAALAGDHGLARRRQRAAAERRRARRVHQGRDAALCRPTRRSATSSDLQNVMGMTPEIYAQDRPYLTTRGSRPDQCERRAGARASLAAGHDRRDAQSDPATAVAGPTHHGPSSRSSRRRRAAAGRCPDSWPAPRPSNALRGRAVVTYDDRGRADDHLARRAASAADES